MNRTFLIRVILFALLAAPCSDQAFAQKDATVEQFQGADRVVCVWKPGTLAAAREAISATTFKLVEVSPFVPKGVCIWDGELTQHCPQYPRRCFPRCNRRW